jgi:hypothetical protein
MALFALGVAPDAVLRTAAEESFRELVPANPEASGLVAASQMPLSRYLQDGKEYTLEFTSKEYGQFTVLNAGSYTALKGAGGGYGVAVRAKKGLLLVGGWRSKHDNDFSGTVR